MLGLHAGLVLAYTVFVLLLPGQDPACIDDSLFACTSARFWAGYLGVLAGFPAVLVSLVISIAVLNIVVRRSRDPGPDGSERRPALRAAAGATLGGLVIPVVVLVVLAVRIVQP